MLQEGSETSVSAMLRLLPSVQTLIADHTIQAATPARGTALTRLLRSELDGIRAKIQAGAMREADHVVDVIARSLAARERPRLSPIINATGIVIHTNLGRAPVSDATAEAMAAAARSAVTLEIDAELNTRGGRMQEITSLMRLLTGAEATLVVNNNAAAVFLVLAAMAASRQVVLSRGEAVEIGGGFRIPDVLRQSGADLVEVGTTNRTYARDYASAITDRTALLMKVHPSNFRIIGFTHEASVAELAELGEAHGVPVVDDQGSGLLLETTRLGLPAEHTISESILAGASIVTASGDKLLGGPQAGIITGKATWVELIATHPLARAVRADKTCLAGVAATLRHYARGEAVEAIPVWQMIAATVHQLRDRAKTLQEQLKCASVSVSIVDTESSPGGGSLPGATIPSVALRIECRTGSAGVEELSRRLRTGRLGVFGRIEEGALLLDMRTVHPRDDRELRQAVLDAYSGSG